MKGVIEMATFYGELTTSINIPRVESTERKKGQEGQKEI